MNDLNKFMSKVKVSGLDDCWEWQGCRNPQGYGATYFNGRTEGTHRVSHKLFHGDIPKGMETMHSCDNPPCVNPNHLSLGTKLDNMTDAVQKGR